MNILLTSAGRRTYLVKYFIEALNGEGKLHASNSEMTYALKAADHYFISPLIYEKNYIESVLDYCTQNKIRAVLTLFDIDLPVLSKNKRRFQEKGITVIVADENFIEACNDKWLTYTFLKENGFQVPQTYLSMASAQKDIEQKKLGFPLIVKPRWGMGSIGIYEADNSEELFILYNKTLKNIRSSYLKFESGENVNESVIIQEKLNGDEYGLEIFDDLHGNFLTAIPKKKLAMRSGETDIAEIVENPQLYAIGKKLASLSRHPGNLDVDCFLVNGQFYILEMNARFGGQYPFSHLSGVNFPKAIIKLLNNLPVPKDLLQAKIGIIGVKDILPVILK